MYIRSNDEKKKDISQVKKILAKENTKQKKDTGEDKSKPIFVEVDEDMLFGGSDSGETSPISDEDLFASASSEEIIEALWGRIADLENDIINLNIEINRLRNV